MSPRRLMLCILDGWGCTTCDADDAIYLANTPCFDSLLAQYPNCRLGTSGSFVGLPEGQAGNSEVGHAVIGGGRIIKTDLMRIDDAIATGELADILRSHLHQGNYHVLGLLSDGGVHSHIAHFIYVARFLGQMGKRVFLHCILDGRDTLPQSAMLYLSQLMEAISAMPNVTIATMGGRFYAMDRDSNWDRTQLAYDALVWARGEFFSNPIDYINSCYDRGITDEFIPPAVHFDYNGVGDEENLLMINFRADRARQILESLTDKAFNAFKARKQFHQSLGMVSYSAKLNKHVTCLFSPSVPQKTLGEIIADAGLTQLRLSESEKYAHVTFFFNGGTETRYMGEDRVMIPSPKVATYDLQPAMSSVKMTDALCDALGNYDFIVTNYPGADMVGHTGNMVAAIKAVESVDIALQRLIAKALASNTTVIIAADHGNAEQMLDKHMGGKFTAHTANPTPFILVDQSFIGHKMRSEGTLADIAPTILDLLDLPKPEEMTGSSLIVKEEN